MDYKSAGVDIAGGDAWVDVIKRLVRARGSSLPRAGEIGSFSGLFPIGGGRSLAACTDGVGTKIEVARATGIYRGLGQDLAAMSVNDLVTCGASPLFFLDYLACGALDVARMSEIMEGLLDACEESHCALLGGETAEMPGVYPTDGFDLAGFAVGIVDDDRVIDGSRITSGDVLIGLPSSGIHSNGYSLVRRALLEGDGALDMSSRPDRLEGRTIGEALMAPTRIYVRQAEAAASTGRALGMAHITGGGLEANTSRVLPDGVALDVDWSAWERPAVFDMIAERGVDEAEMRRVFNLGIGFVIIAHEGDAQPLIDVLAGVGESPVRIGRVVSARGRDGEA